jgi:hypothetical protein
VKISPEDVAADLDPAASDEAKASLLDEIQSLMDKLEESRLHATSAHEQLGGKAKAEEAEEAEEAEGEGGCGCGGKAGGCEKCKMKGGGDSDLAALKALAKE